MVAIARKSQRARVSTDAGQIVTSQREADKPPQKWIDSNGLMNDDRIKREVIPRIEHGQLAKVNGIVVHQTGGSTADGTLTHYRDAKENADGYGAHFLIEKDGTIYQTASLFKKARHVGRLQSRCLAEHTCSPDELKKISKLTNKQVSSHEAAKPWPDRYPSNADSVGIEIVGRCIDGKDDGTGTYEAVTAEQNASLQWLVRALSANLGVSMKEVFRHPVVSRKNATEASTADWVGTASSATPDRKSGK